MKRRAFILFGAAVLLLAIAASPAAAAGLPGALLLAGEPSWVTPVSFPAPPDSPDGAPASGLFFLLDDVQTRLFPRGRDVFFHRAFTIANAKGLETGGEVSVDFDPGYDTPVFHKITLYRHGKAYPRLEPSAISVFRSEEAVQDRMLDGSMTAQAIIHDVRVGDLVEYSYTIRRKNPVFPEIYDAAVPLAWSVPVGRTYLRLLCPKTRKLTFTPHGTEDLPVERDRGSEIEYVLDLFDVPPVVEEDDLPDWYDPYPWLQISETGTWEEVASLCADLYPEPALSPELEKLSAAIAAEHPDPEGRLMEAFARVRDDVRYLGLEYGPHSHEPTAPSETYARRYGDCKDKAYLLSSLLHSLGIEAWPALVNVDQAGRVADWSPSPFAFDHVIVLAKVGGKDFWCDPTDTPARGDFDHLTRPGYGLALVVSRDTRALKKIEAAPPSAPTRETELFFDCTVPEGSPVALTVKTVYRGAEADSLRDHLMDQGRTDLEASYINYYASDYPFIERAAPMSVADDQKENRITVSESYGVKEFFTEGEGGRQEASVYGDEVEALLDLPRTRIRSQPLAVRHPADLRQTVTVRLPWRADVSETKQRVKDPAFIFTRSVGAKGGTYKVVYTLKTTDDSVAPGRVAEYLANVRKVRHLLFYDVPGPEERPLRGSRFDLALAAAAVLALAAVLMLRRVARKPGRPDLRGPISP